MPSPDESPLLDCVRTLATLARQRERLAATLRDGPPDLDARRERDRLVAADGTATTRLFTLGRSKVESVARRILRTYPGAWDIEPSDVAAEVLVRIRNRAVDFRGDSEGEARQWLYVIARNEATTVIRRDKAARDVGAVTPDSEEAQRLALRDASIRVEEAEKDHRATLNRRAFLAAGRDWLPVVIHTSTESAVDLVESKLPEDLHQLGRSKAIGATRKSVEKNVLVWELFKIEPLLSASADDGRDEEDEGEVARHVGERVGLSRSSVAKYAERGCCGLEAGRERALRPEFSPYLEDDEGMLMLHRFHPRALKQTAKARNQDKRGSTGGVA